MDNLELIKKYHKEVKNLRLQGWSDYDILHSRLQLPMSFWKYYSEDQNGHSSLSFGIGIYYSNGHQLYQEITVD